MNARAAVREAIERLAAAEVPSASTTAEVLLLHVLGRERAFLYAHPEAELTPEQQRAYRNLVSARATGTPTQYLTGQQEFWGLTFLVRPGVFIPRPETEHVVEVALAIVRERLRNPRARIVDVGTGTGCIALALAQELPEAEIIAVDIDPAALAVARENATRLNLAQRVRFLQSDLLEVFLEAERQGSKEAGEAKEAKEADEAKEAARWSPVTIHGPQATGHGPRFDLIVSNPPYVSEAEAAELPREVREHEPPAALFSPDEGLGVTRRLIAQAEQLLGAERQGSKEAKEAEEANEAGALAPEVRSTEHESRSTNQPAGGWLVLELGYQMATRVRSLLGEAWTNIEITEDLRGIPRVLAAQQK